MSKEPYTVGELLMVLNYAKRVREAQKRYFASRSQSDLRASKELEKNFDIILENALKRDYTEANNG